MTSAPPQRSPHRRPGARRQSHRVASPSKSGRILRSRTRDSQARLRGRQWQGRIGGLGRGVSHPLSRFPPHLLNDSRNLHRTAQRQASLSDFFHHHQGRQGHGARFQRQRQPHHQ